MMINMIIGSIRKGRFFRKSCIVCDGYGRKLTGIDKSPPIIYKTKYGNSNGSTCLNLKFI